MDIVRVNSKFGRTEQAIWFYCPGCDMLHAFFVVGTYVWSWNESYDNATFSPSLKNTCRRGSKTTDDVCHLFLNNNHIEYLSDCTHAYAGKTIPVPDLNLFYGDSDGD